MDDKAFDYFDSASSKVSSILTTSVTLSSQYADFIGNTRSVYGIDTHLTSIEQRLPSHLNSTEAKVEIAWPLPLLNSNQLSRDELVPECSPMNDNGYTDLGNLEESSLFSPLGNHSVFYNVEGALTIPLRSDSQNICTSSNLENNGVQSLAYNVQTQDERSLPKNEQLSLNPNAFVDYILTSNVTESIPFINADLEGFEPYDASPLTPSFYRRRESNQHRDHSPETFRRKPPGFHKESKKIRKIRSEVKKEGVEVNVCQFCERPFKRKHDLQRHIRLHTGEKPFPCTRCDLAFSRTDTLRRHLRQSHECLEHPIIFFI